jgi:hypothetical protein
MSMLQVEITIAPVIGGFVVTYPRAAADGTLEFVQEVATTPGKAVRIAKAAVEEYSLVKKDDASEA